VIEFLIIAFTIFLVVRQINKGADRRQPIKRDRYVGYIGYVGYAGYVGYEEPAGDGQPI
jgi:hypothetical protein